MMNDDPFNNIWEEPLWNNAPIGMGLVSWKNGSEGLWLKVNEELCKMLGYSELELKKKTFMDVTYREDIPPDINNVLLSIKTKKGFQMVKRYISKNDKIFWVKLTANPVYDVDGNFLYFLSWVEKLPNGGNFKITKEESGNVSFRPQISVLEFLQDNWKMALLIGFLLLGYIEKKDVLSLLLKFFGG